MLHRSFVLLVAALCVPMLCKPPSKGPHRTGYCSVGTEELNTAMDNWADQVRRAGNVAPQHEGRGNLPGAQALLDKICDMAPTSEPMTDADVQKGVTQFGVAPAAFPVAIEALVLVVPRHLPLPEIEQSQAANAFHNAPADWASLGRHQIQVPLKVYGLNSASDRYRFIKRQLLKQTNVSDRVIEIGGPLELVDKVGASAGGLGYARPAELTERVKALTIRDGGKIARPDVDTIVSGRYPLARYYYIYLRPDQIEKGTRDFMNVIYSAEGQRILTHIGLFPLSEKDRKESLNRLETIPLASQTGR